MTKRTGALGALIRSYYKFNIYVFGNMVNLRVNMLYKLYIWLLRLGYRLGLSNKPQVSGASQKEAEAIHLNGFTKLLAVLPEEDVKSISSKIDRLFTKSDKTVKTLEEGGLLHLKSCMLEVPELEHYIMAPRVKEVIQGYFGSAYKVYSCEVYRTIPAKSENPEVKFQSLKWHFDNCPSELLKVMFYLTDTDAENGALTLVDKETSSRLKKQGFWDRNNLKNFEDTINANAQILDAPAGTALLFSTHFCIHKASLPKSRHRDVAVFLLYPALTSPFELTDDEKKNASYRYGYCVNPFLGTPQKYGDG